MGDAGSLRPVKRFSQRLKNKPLYFLSNGGPLRPSCANPPHPESADAHARRHPARTIRAQAETDAVIAGGGQPADDRAEEDAGPAPADVLPDDDEQEAHPETEPEAGPEDEPDEGADEANVSADLPTDAQPPDAGGEAPRSDGADGAGADAPLVDGELADGDEDDLANEPADEGRSAAADEDDGAEAGEAEANEAAGGGEGGADGDGVEPGALGEGEEGEGGDDGAEPGDDDEGQYAAGDAEGGEEGADEGEEGAAAHASGGARVYDDDDVEPRDDTAEAEADEAEEEDGEEEDEEEEAGGMYGDDDDDAYNDFDMGLDGGDPLGEEAALSEAELAAQIAERFDAARDEHDARLEANQVLQRKLVEHLRTAKSAEEKVAEEGERASAHEQEGRYVKALAQLQTLKAALAQVQERFDAHAAEMNKKLTQKEEKAREIADAFADFKREIMAAAENSRTSRPIAPKLIRHFDDAERKRDDELAQMRLTHISRRNQKDKLEYTLRQKEKLADGLHLCAHRLTRGARGAATPLTAARAVRAACARRAASTSSSSRSRTKRSTRRSRSATRSC